MTKALTALKIAKKLGGSPEWSLRGKAIRRTFSFDDFLQAMVFVKKLSIDAEKLNHHPDIIIRYDKVTLILTTHDAGGITAKDFRLAGMFDGIYDSIAKL